MSPRTRIRDEQTEDISFISEFELNEFFSDVVVTGTETQTAVIQTFDEYLPGRGLITEGTGITVITGSNFVQISSTAGQTPLPLVGDSFVSVITGTNQVNLYTDAIVSGSSDLTVTSGSNTVVLRDNNRAVIGDAFIGVVSGTSTIQLVADAIVGVSSNTTVISGTNTLTVSGVVTVTSGIAYINDSTRGEKSLSVSRPVFSFGYNGLADGNYLHTATAEHTSTGFPIFRPATITSLSAFFPSGPNNNQIEIRKNGVASSIKTFLVSANNMHIQDAENIDLNKGDVLQVFVTSALTGAQDPVVNIEIAWRLP